METITPINPEQQTLGQIPAKDVWKGFETFEKASQEGFDTPEDRIRSYGQFMAKVADFFAQPQLLDSPTPEQRDLVRRLFYAHQTTARIPIDFFVDARKRLEKEVLEKRYVRPAGKKWQDEIDFIRQLTKTEFQRTAQELGIEINGRRKLENLAQGTPDSSDTAVSLDIKSGDEMRRQIQERAVDFLAKDPDLAQDVAQKNDYVRTLRTLLSEYDPAKVEEVLAGYKTYLEKPGEPSVVDEVGRRIFLNQHDKVKEIIGQTVDEAQQPDFMWRLWVDKGNIPPQLLDSFEEVMTLSRLSETVRQTSGMSKNARARHLLTFVNEGVSSTMISEIVEGKYELPDDFIYRQIDAFIHFNDVYQDVKKSPVTLKRKLMSAALAAMVVTAIPDTALIEQGKTAAAEIEELLQQVNSDELGGGIQGLGGRGVGDTSRGKNEPRGQSAAGGERSSSDRGSFPKTESEFSDEGYSYSDIFKPDNASMEAFEAMMKIKEWDLSGPNPWGYYRTATADLFDHYGNDGFRWNRVVPKEFGVLGFEFGNREDVTFSKTITVSKDRFEIPVQFNSLLVKKGSDSFIRLSDIVGIKGVTDFQLIGKDDGTYYLLFKKDDYGKKATISFSLEKTKESKIPNPDNFELQNMKYEMADVKNLPKDVQNFLSEMNKNKGLSMETKAKLMEKYIKTKFLYSLNPKWSDYYHEAKDASNFFRRIFEIKKADCDVANTALVALLRSQGIPARMAFGYAHNGAVNNDPNKIMAVEGHGWTEAYIDGKWITLDGTPSDQEDATKEFLKDKLHPSQIASQLAEDAVIFAESVKAFHIENPELALWLDGILLNLGAAGLSVLSRRKSSRLAGKLQEALQRRVREYGSWPGSQRVFETEAYKLGKLWADELGNPFSLIPPFIQFRAGGDFERRKGLTAIESAYSKGTEVSSSSPNEFEFLTAVLGYKEADIRREMYKRAYDETMDRLHWASSDLQNDALADLNEQGSSIFSSFRWGIIPDELKALERPQDPTSWEEIKRKTKEDLFAQYQELVDKSVAKDRAKVKPGAEYIEPGRLTEKDFGDIIDTLLRIQAVKWIVKDSYDAAMAALPQS